MFGCFTTNIYVSKICLHFVCAFEIPKDSFEKGRNQERAGLWWGRMLLLFVKLWGLGSSGFDAIVKPVSRVCIFFVPVPLRTQPFFNPLTSICTYKQSLQRNTFTGVDWLVHNYPTWNGSVCGISHKQCFWSITLYSLPARVCWVI